MRKVDHDSRREEVAAAAARLIAEQGLDALTTRALAKQLGCSIGVLSHYFNSKEDIVIAAFNWADLRIDARMQEAMLGGDDLSLDAFIPLIQAGLPLDAESDLEWRVRFNLYNFALTHRNSLKAQGEKIRHFRALMTGLIEQLQKTGKVRRDIDARQITNAAFDLAMGAAQHLLMLPMEERQDYARYLFDLVEQLRPR